MSNSQQKTTLRRVSSISKTTVWRNLHTADVLLMFLALTISITVLLGYRKTQDGFLSALLWPHAQVVTALYHVPLSYQPGTGYVAAGNHYAIGSACMGINFIIMLFLLIICVFVNHYSGFWKIVFFITTFVGSVIIGMITSCIRIIGSIPFTTLGQFSTIHTGIGITLYLAALISCYFLTNKITGGIHEQHM